MNGRQLKRIFPNASEALLALNACGSELPKNDPREGATEDSDPRDCAKLERDSRPCPLGPSQTQEGDSRRFLVRVTSVRNRLIDEDNLCEKYAVDCCRYAGLLPGDGPSQTQIEVAQRKAGKGEGEKTVIEVFGPEETR